MMIRCVQFSHCGRVNNQPALFDCIGESDVVEESFALLKIEDQSSWMESIPY